MVGNETAIFATTVLRLFVRSRLVQSETMVKKYLQENPEKWKEQVDKGEANA